MVAIISTAAFQTGVRDTGHRQRYIGSGEEQSRRFLKVAGREAHGAKSVRARFSR